MDWYWIVALSLAWIVSLYVYAYKILGITPQRVDALLEGMAFYGYLLLWASWPAIVLSQGLISAAWYVWLLLAVEAVCLLFLAIISGERRRKKHGSKLDLDFPEIVVSSVLVAFFLGIAPLGIALYLISKYATSRQALEGSLKGFS